MLSRRFLACARRTVPSPSRRGLQKCPRTNASFPHFNDDGHLRSDRACGSVARSKSCPSSSTNLSRVTVTCSFRFSFVQRVRWSLLWRLRPKMRLGIGKRVLVNQTQLLGTAEHSTGETLGVTETTAAEVFVLDQRAQHESGTSTGKLTQSDSDECRFQVLAPKFFTAA